MEYLTIFDLNHDANGHIWKCTLSLWHGVAHERWKSILSFSQKQFIHLDVLFTFMRYLRKCAAKWIGQVHDHTCYTRDACVVCRCQWHIWRDVSEHFFLFFTLSFDFGAVTVIAWHFLKSIYILIFGYQMRFAFIFFFILIFSFL